MPLTPRQKALNYVFWKEFNDFGHSLVDVKEASADYIVRYETPGQYGNYYVLRYPKTEAIEAAINKALHVLNWIAQGNEFPDQTSRGVSHSA